MDQPKISDFPTMIGLLQKGVLVRELNAENERILKTLKEMAGDNPKVKVKGKLTLTLDFEVSDGMADITSKVDVKLPRAAKPRSIYWVTNDGRLSHAHPQQQSLFAGPRVVEDEQHDEPRAAVAAE